MHRKAHYRSIAFVFTFRPCQISDHFKMIIYSEVNKEIESWLDKKKKKTRNFGTVSPKKHRKAHTYIESYKNRNVVVKYSIVSHVSAKNKFSEFKLHQTLVCFRVIKYSEVKEKEKHICYA